MNKSVNFFETYSNNRSVDSVDVCVCVCQIWWIKWGTRAARLPMLRESLSIRELKFHFFPRQGPAVYPEF